MKLIKYIKKYYGGNKAAFWKDNGVDPSNAYKAGIDYDDWEVVGDKLYSQTSHKLKLKISIGKSKH